MLMLAGCTAPVQAQPAVTETVATETAASEPVPKVIGVSYDCLDENFENELTLNALSDVWNETKSLGELNCEATLTEDGELTGTEAKALKKAYGEDAERDDLSILYGICTEMSIEETGSKTQADEMAGAFMLCPDHPKKKKIKKSIAMGLAAEKEQAAIEKDRKNGKFVSEGAYLIGKDVVPGTWRSQGEKVTDCYWEVSDASGNIIDNNSINVAPQFTITVPASASGLTIRGCSFRWVHP